MISVASPQVPMRSQWRNVAATTLSAAPEARELLFDVLRGFGLPGP